MSTSFNFHHGHFTFLFARDIILLFYMCLWCDQSSDGLARFRLVSQYSHLVDHWSIEIDTCHRRLGYLRWRHQMETYSALLAICAGNSPVPGEFPTQRPVTRSFDVFFDLRLNKQFSKPSRGWWFETLSRSLWRHRNVKTRESALLTFFMINRWEGTRISNCIRSSQRNVITRPWHNFNGGLATPPLKPAHGRVITSHSFLSV